MDIKKLKQKRATKELLEFGIINIDKPAGPTSFNVSDFVRESLKNLGIRKTSHFGTLDPKVTGVLPIALNRACKLTGFFLGEDKEYVGIMKVHKDFSLEKLKKIINEKFIGNILQKPPKKSRVKREEREREVKKFGIIEENGLELLFHAEVQGGTYIRKLIDDIGKEFGIGAHMMELRRIRAGIFGEDSCISLYEFESAIKDFIAGDEKKIREVIIPGEVIAELYTSINVRNEIVSRLFNGSPLFVKDVSNNPEIKEKRVCVFSEDKFIGVYSLVRDNDTFARPEFVLQPIK